MVSIYWGGVWATLGDAYDLLLAFHLGITPYWLGETYWGLGSNLGQLCTKQAPYTLCYHSRSQWLLTFKDFLVR